VHRGNQPGIAEFVYAALAMGSEAAVYCVARR
jgi:hypothetical protein